MGLDRFDTYYTSSHNGLWGQATNVYPSLYLNE